MEDTSIRPPDSADRSVATPPPSTTPTPAPVPPRESSVKETIESILIAFILAFIFRAFVVEAFVIPTGSMATTLLGAHMRFRCPDCGYRFDVNYSARQSGEDLTIPTRAGPEPRREVYMGQERTVWVDKVYDVRCPNCGYQLPRADTTNPEVNYGDRILVLKYLYLFQQPRRWDVVVFKSPDDVPAYQQNYIKRLIGKPGESICILDGDIYVGKGDDLTKFQIQTKPRYVQEALWRNIYNNDYFPLGLARADPWRQPWVVKSGSGWDGPAGGASPTDVASTHKQQRVFSFNNPSGSSTIRFDPNANPTQAFTDALVYDVEQVATPNPVSDLKLDFFYERKSGNGPLRLAMTKEPNTFIAEITPGHAKLLCDQHDMGHQVLLGEADIPKTTSPQQIELVNHDYQVTLRIADKDVIVTTPQQYHPDIRRLLADYEEGRLGPIPSVEITANSQQSILSHLNLSRDVYYINRRPPDMPPFAATPHNIMHLGPKEYFVLGDNSLISGDARYWNHPIELPFEDLRVAPGRVPDRFMLGKAFFVYWPAGFRPFSGAPPIAPDFGDMRFIR